MNGWSCSGRLRLGEIGDSRFFHHQEAKVWEISALLSLTSAPLRCVLPLLISMAFHLRIGSCKAGGECMWVM